MGSGYKTFTAGAVLTASDVQNYLQDQSVMVFGGTAARSSAIGTANFEEGMLTYLTDVDKLQVYTGATFADVYPPATSNQGLTLINTTSFSGVSSVSLPTATFSATYDNYEILFDYAASTSIDNFLRMRVSGSDATDSTYQRQILNVGSTSVTASRSGNQTNFYFGQCSTQKHYAKVTIVAPFKTTPTQFFLERVNNSDATDPGINLIAGGHNNSTSYDSLTVYNSSGTITGTYSVFGYNK